jgi:uncharacterized membrane protein
MNQWEKYRMKIERIIDIDAPREKVWTVMIDVERWPEWTASVTSVALLDKTPFDVGSHARIRQPHLPVAVWTVTAFEPEHYFEWRTGVLGVRTVAGHRVEAIGSAGARVTLSVSWSGLLAPLIGLLYSKRSRHYVGMEAQGLGQRCEAF